MMSSAEAEEAWCPSTFSPSRFGRMWLAWWIIPVESPRAFGRSAWRQASVSGLSALLESWPASWAAPPEPLGHHADRPLHHLGGVEDHVLAEATADDLHTDRLAVVLVRGHDGGGQAHEVHGVAVQRAAEHLAHALGALLVAVPGEDRRREERGQDQRMIGQETGPG